MSQRFRKPLFLLLLILIVVLPPLRRCAGAGGLALLTAAAIARPVGRLEGRHWPRWLAVAAVLGGSVTVLLLLLGFGLNRLCGAADGIAGLCSDLPALTGRLQELTRLLPGPAGRLLSGLVNRLSPSTAELPRMAAAKAARLCASALSGLPDKALFLLITLLASFYAALDWPRLRRQLTGLVPEDWSKPAWRVLRSLRTGAGGWLRAQGRLLLIQFLLLWAGLLLLRLPGAFQAAALIALADALPLLGSAAVLLTWALLLWLERRVGQAAGLAVLSLVVWLARTLLEPRLVGRQAGVSPFYTLLAMYLGLLTLGVAGLIAAPVVTAAAAKLVRSEE